MWRDQLKLEDINVPNMEHKELIANNWARIITERPPIATFLNTHVNITLREYSKKIIANPSNINPIAKNIILDYSKKYFSDSIIDSLSKTLETVGTIDTSSHGGILSEDTLVQSQMILASGVSSFNLDSMISLACGVVPMNNSTWPRGFFRAGKRESIFPKSFDRTAVHECKSFTLADIDKKINSKDSDSCTKEILEFIKNIPNLFSWNKFTDQLILINYHLWKDYFNFTGINNFIHLPLESITAELICSSIENNDALCSLLFCDKHRELFFESLSGLPGTWTKDKTKGTYLFWLKSGDFRAASLWEKNAKLEGDNFSISFTPEEVLKNIKSGMLVPSVFSSLITLLYYGVRPSGGYHQIVYLPEYAHRLSNFSKQTQSVDCPVFTQNINCADLIQLGYGFVFAEDQKSLTGFAGMDYFVCNKMEKSDFDHLMNTRTVLNSVISNTSRWYSEIVKN
jgi:hypothetical protein